MVYADMELTRGLVLLQKIASGGSSDIYKARRICDDAVVAVKRSHTLVGMEQARKEAELLMRMRHPYLPEVYDCYVQDGAVYTVMEYIPGRNLKEAVRRDGPLPQESVMKWTFMLAQVLSFLHGRTPPVVHGDIKPSNIMVTPEGDIRLLDFHISITLQAGRANARGYTKGYAPPEQYRSVFQYELAAGIEEDTAQNGSEDETYTFRDGEPPVDIWRVNDVPSASLARQTQETAEAAAESQDIRGIIGLGLDERSDVYSLGATLYHLLTGRRPDTDFNCIVPIDQFGLCLNAEFTRAICRMMSLQPEQRYRSGTELLKALNGIMKE